MSFPISLNEKRIEELLQSEIAERRRIEDKLKMPIDLNAALDAQPIVASTGHLETHLPAQKTRMEQAETRTEQAEARTEQARTRTEQAETRSEQAEARTEQAKTRTEQAELRSEQAETRTEQAIRASELGYRRLFETAQDGILILNADTGQVVDANPFMKDLLGYSQEEFLGRKLWEIGPFKGVVASKIAFAGLQHTDRLRYEGLPLERKDGRQVEVEFTSNAYRADQQRLIQCNIRDLTARKAAEMVSIRLAAIVDSSDDAIIGTDLNGVITSWNNGAEKIFGYTTGEMVGTSVMRLIPADRQQEEEQVLGQIKRGEQVDHFETLRQTRGGRLIDVSITVSPIKDASGTLVGVSMVARDITERRQAADEIRRLNAELEQRIVERTAQLESANQELEAFSYSVSHDLRAPLRAVDGFSQAVLEDYGSLLPKEGLHYLQTIRGGAQKMGKLIDDLLTFSRLSRAPLHKQEVNTGELVRSVLDDLGPQRQGRQIDLRIGDLPSCVGDPALLKQVWINLLSNALKYTKKRAAAVVEIGCGAKPEGSVWFVRDNGAGFDPRYADKLFGVFQRLHRAEEYEGTGVGLAIVQQIIHRHGGRIWAEAAVDRGATFYFTLEGEAKP